MQSYGFFLKKRIFIRKLSLYYLLANELQNLTNESARTLYENPG